MYNQMICVGRLARDNELKYLPSGQAVLKNSIATSHGYKDQQGNKVEKPMFMDIVVWGKGAEICNQYTRKGSLLFVKGRVELEKWQAQDGTNRQAHKLIVDEFKFLDSKDSVPQQGEYHQNGSYNQNYDNQMQGASSQPASGYENNTGGQTYQDGMNQQPAMQDNIPEIDIDNDEIPF